MTERAHYEIPLFDVGVDGAGFRVENDGDELQRAAIDQYRDSDIKYMADLVAVVHGSMSPAEQEDNDVVPAFGGHQVEDTKAFASGRKRGILLVIDFQFLSNPRKHRFKRVHITVAFGRNDDPIGSANEPVVKQLAPTGTFRMDEAMQTQVEKVEAHGSLEGGWNPATLGLGASFERTSTIDTKSYAILSGMSWIEGRNKGPKNAATWDLRENSTLASGVPANLRAAILLELPDEARFRAEITMAADVGVFRKKVKRTVGAKTGLHPVYFDPSETMKRDYGAPPEAVVKTNLGGYNLDSVGYAKTPTILM
ncbi:hypothetical protein GGR58DRAFT_229277 [Xylaria digitata]|nr:hypothetical protein GGR58DRAFT_229277 [Xylaria digitata]